MRWKKIHKFALLNTAFYSNKNYDLIKGNYGIKSLSTSLLKYKHLEAARRRISKQFKRLEKKRFRIFIRISIWQAYTKKPFLTRMGKGAGPIIRWIALIKAGSILIEILSCKPFFVVKAIVAKAVFNLPIKTVFISKR